MIEKMIKLHFSNKLKVGKINVEKLLKKKNKILITLLKFRYVFTSLF